MRVLILTSINPVIAGELYASVVNHFGTEKERDFDILCFPYFAQIKTMNEEEMYIPNFFGMIQASREEELHRKLYKRKNTVVIGNTYKDEPFDMVVSFDDIEGEVFDSYIEMLKQEEDAKDFRKRVNIDNLYKPEDAEIQLPTKRHVLDFLKNVYEKDGSHEV